MQESSGSGRDRDEVADLRRQLDARIRATELTERRLAEARADARAIAQTNEKLNATLREARASLLTLREQLEQLGRPPASFGTVVGLVDPQPGANEPHTPETLVDVVVSGRRLRVGVLPDVAGQDATGSGAALEVGASVLLNEAMTVVGVVPRTGAGDLVRVEEVLPDGRLVVASGDEVGSVLTRAAALVDVEVAAGDQVLADRRAFVALAVVDRSEADRLLLEDVPDVTWGDIGGLGAQIEAIRDAVELPVVHRATFEAYGLAAPKGVLLYGPPGCGKTMIAKAVANAVGSHFLNIKGPELLDKYVGETERQIRTIFARARELAADGRPVIVFFDEMDALFRTRGSGVSSDVEATIVPQLLAELDGVQPLANVIVIGATNREDLIDPAILRPGRLDVKIRLERPDAAGSAEILGKYLDAAVPVRAEEGDAPDGVRAALVAAAVDALHARDEANRFVEVTYASGVREVLYAGDFVSGAMLANIVARAKKAAVKAELAGEPRGVTEGHLLGAVRAEVAESEDLVGTTSPDDWARVSGRRGERITYLRTLHGSRSLAVDAGRA